MLILRISNSKSSWNYRGCRILRATWDASHVDPNKMDRNYSNIIAGFRLLAKQLKALLYPAYAKQNYLFHTFDAVRRFSWKDFR
jgi:hypothetical protein